jgi:hypothetical protein
MKIIEEFVYWTNKIWPWIVIPTLIFAALLVGLLWGEEKKAVRS